MAPVRPWASPSRRSPRSPASSSGRLLSTSFQPLRLLFASATYPKRHKNPPKASKIIENLAKTTENLAKTHFPPPLFTSKPTYFSSRPPRAMSALHFLCTTFRRSQPDFLHELLLSLPSLAAAGRGELGGPKGRHPTLPPGPARRKVLGRQSKVDEYGGIWLVELHFLLVLGILWAENGLLPAISSSKSALRSWNSPGGS